MRYTFRQTNLNEAEKPKTLTAADFKDRAVIFIFFNHWPQEKTSEGERRLQENPSSNVGRAV